MVRAAASEGWARRCSTFGGGRPVTDCGGRGSGGWRARRARRRRVICWEAVGWAMLERWAWENGIMVLVVAQALDWRQVVRDGGDNEVDLAFVGIFACDSRYWMA